MTKKTMFILSVFLICFCRSAPAQRQLYTGLEEARKAVKDDNFALAQESYEMLVKNMDELPLAVQEMILWESADLCSRRGKNAVAEIEKFHFYDKAVEKWGSYLAWIFVLSEMQKEELRRSGNDRAGGGIHNLAIAFVDRGNRQVASAPCGGIYEMFAALNRYQAEFFMPDTINWWKLWLMKYSNDWKDTSGKSYKFYVRSCHQTEHDCLDMWVEYKEFLKKTILTNHNLNPQGIGHFLAMVEFIESVK